MKKFHYEILSNKQKELLFFLGKIKSKFVLCGGTAISLLLGHRKSIDFDLFYFDGKLPLDFLLKKENNFLKDKNLLIDLESQRDIVVNQVKISYISYPFKIKDDFINGKYFKTPDLITLGAMKAYSIGRRAKWKDYVDLYFLIKTYGIEKLIAQAKSIFGNNFNEKMFIRQLGYFDDIDYSEKVEFIQGFEVKNEIIKNYLKSKSLDYIL